MKVESRDVTRNGKRKKKRAMEANEAMVLSKK